MPILRSLRLYACYYRLWCAVLGCWLSGVRRRAVGYASGKRNVAQLQSCNIPLPGLRTYQHPLYMVIRLAHKKEKIFTVAFRAEISML
jgi:hypothetical protein